MRRLTITILAIASICWFSVVQAETNKALDAWKAYAAESANPGHAKWVEEISQPESLALAKAWKEMRGYDAYDIMEKAELPADLKPGLKITRGNAASFPWLKDYLPQQHFESLTSNDWGTIGEITIVPTNTYYMSQAVLDATKDRIAQGVMPEVQANGELLNPDGSYTLVDPTTANAIPFLHPKDGMELNWSYVAHAVGTETLFFKPIEMSACTAGANAKIDRHYKADLWWQKFHGRALVPPLGDVPDKEEYIEGGSIFFLEPFDIRGLAGVRQRYAEAGVDDDFKVFIPSLRRTRVLTGSDAQDPIASGLELTWDDWRAYWGKTDTAKFTYEITGEGFILALPEVGYVYDAYEQSDSKCNHNSLELELRPAWKLNITDKTGKYIYKTRTTWVDKENFYMQFHVTTDPRDNVMRIWDDSRAFRPRTGEAQWRYVIVSNYVNQRFNFLQMEPVWENRAELVGEEKFDVDQLRDYQ